MCWVVWLEGNLDMLGSVWVFWEGQDHPNHMHSCLHVEREGRRRWLVLSPSLLCKVPVTALHTVMCMPSLQDSPEFCSWIYGILPAFSSSPPPSAPWMNGRIGQVSYYRLPECKWNSQKTLQIGNEHLLLEAAVAVSGWPDASFPDGGWGFWVMFPRPQLCPL